MVLRAIGVTVALTSVLANAPPAGAESLGDCAQRVIRDWLAVGRVDKPYPLRCYHAAIRALPEDVRQYTDAGHAIERALEQARRSRSVRPPPGSTTPRARAAASPVGEQARSRPAARPGEPRSTNDAARVASGPQPSTASPGLPYAVIALGALVSVLLASALAAGLARRRR